ncbi:aspartate/glutamate racemase family protein [Niabella ginsengisoli]|uniref:SIR2-like domain-containing protein n=1 Tax=Niabella ginsengisoli TaxID=522298 RepID=A0ABS9SKL8_9BACT|nr:hypothetical protein [Niabella ginsengisoli]MCH5598928.1 hypothetical protein [Niabella ginsengisoli]
MLQLLGLGNYATQFYLHVLNQMAEEEWGEYATFPLRLVNVNFQELNPFLPDQFEKLVPAIRRILTQDEAGADEWLIPNITLFETIDRLPASISSRCIHAVEETAKYLQDHAVVKIYLFGSLYTMNATYVKGLLEKNKIRVCLPEPDDQQLLDTLRKEVYAKGKQAEYVVQWNSLLKNIQNIT